MASASTTSTAAYLFKRLYGDNQAGDVAARDHITLNMVRKEAGWTGLSFYYHTKYGNPQGIGNTLTTAITGVSSSSGVQWAASRAKTYGYITLDGEAMAASENDKGAFMDLVTTETEGVLEEVGDTLAFDFWRDGTGNRGRRSSINSNTVTLTVADDARQVAACLSN